jgi:hypothetical protein
MKRGTIGLGILVLGCGLAGGAAAQSEGAAMATAARYHEAARAFELCSGKPLTSAQHDKLAMVIGNETQHAMTIGQNLAVIREARDNMEQRIKATGCKDPLVVDALRTFEQQIRPKLAR